MEKLGTSSLKPLEAQRKRQDVVRGLDFKDRKKDNVQKRGSTTTRDKSQQRPFLFLIKRVDNLIEESGQKKL